MWQTLAETYYSICFPASAPTTVYLRQVSGVGSSGFYGQYHYGLVIPSRTISMMNSLLMG